MSDCQNNDGLHDFACRICGETYEYDEVDAHLVGQYGELSALRAERDALKKRADLLEWHLRATTGSLMDLAPYPPEVAEGVIATVDIARAVLSNTPSPEQQDSNDE